MFQYNEEIRYGYNVFTEMTGTHSSMLMDIGLFKFNGTETIEFLDVEKESVFLLLEGKATYKWSNNSVEVSRDSIFEENPWCLHVPKNTKVEITADIDTEVIIQKTKNDTDFQTKMYTPEDCVTEIFGENVWNNTSKRLVRTIFDYSIAPYSNLVVGEVINTPGKWSSYIPHHHDQPEVYYYRFDKVQGFGASFIGDNVYKIKHNSISAIPGGLSHPQVTAPGYAMYYCWMIRHLDGNPWTDRVNEKEHEWLLDPNVKIWTEN